jgi:hypothetical protein
VQREFWKNANSGCIDIAVLEWSKLFMEVRGKHHWVKSVPDEEAFKLTLYARLRITEPEFIEYGKKIKHYRDKFVAHLDEEPTRFIPRMRQARCSVAFLFDFLRNEPVTADFLPDVRESARERYNSWYRHAVREYVEGSKGLAAGSRCHRNHTIWLKDRGPPVGRHAPDVWNLGL